MWRIVWAWYRWQPALGLEGAHLRAAPLVQIAPNIAIYPEVDPHTPLLVDMHGPFCITTLNITSVLLL